MSAQQPPLTCDEFKAVLRKLGFKPRPMKSGTSHEDWVPSDENAPFRKVTVDCPKAPFSQDLIQSMARQAGVTKAIIYDYHFGRLPVAETTPEETTPAANSKPVGLFGWPKKPKKRHHKG